MTEAVTKGMKSNPASGVLPLLSPPAQDPVRAVSALGRGGELFPNLLLSELFSSWELFPKACLG